jgi:hypothetical protein
VKSVERICHGLLRLLWMDRLVGSIRELAPYAALVFALPGGSLIALALWAARHHPISTLRWRRVRPLMIVVVAVFAFVLQVASSTTVIHRRSRARMTRLRPFSSFFAPLIGRCGRRYCPSARSGDCRSLPQGTCSHRTRRYFVCARCAIFGPPFLRSSLRVSRVR